MKFKLTSVRLTVGLHMSDKCLGDGTDSAEYFGERKDAALLLYDLTAAWANCPC